MASFPVKLLLGPTLRIITWILYIITLVVAYGGYFNPEWFTLPAIGVLFFPYFAMTTLVVAVAWLIRRRYIIGCIGIGVLMACGPTFSAALPFRFSNRAADEGRTFKMITFNCLHMQDSKNPDAPLNRSLHFLIHSGADFICLQELYGVGKPEIPDNYISQIDSLRDVYPYQSVDWSREVEFLSKHPFIPKTIELSNDMTYGSAAAYELDIDGENLTVINVHLPSYLLSEEERNIITEAKNREGVKNSIKEFEGSIYTKMKNAFAMRAKVSEAIAEYAQGVKGNVIVCGDFNDVPGSWAYRNFTKRGFEDAYAMTGFGHLITYNQHMMWFHIDQILYKGELMPLYVTKERMNSSDHYPIVAEFEFL